MSYATAELENFSVRDLQTWTGKDGLLRVGGLVEVSMVTADEEVRGPKVLINLAIPCSPDDTIEGINRNLCIAASAALLRAHELSANSNPS